METTKEKPLKKKQWEQERGGERRAWGGDSWERRGRGDNGPRREHTAVNFQEGGKVEKGGGGTPIKGEKKKRDTQDTQNVGGPSQKQRGGGKEDERKKKREGDTTKQVG